VWENRQSISKFVITILAQLLICARSYQMFGYPVKLSAKVVAFLD